jgi:hypothetical protein
MTRNDQKFREDAAKNSEGETLVSDSLRLLKIPPEKKVFSRNPINRNMNNPEDNNGIRLLAFSNKSVIADRSIPSVNFSVIMLFPNPDFTAPLIGNVIREIRRKVLNQKIRIAFHALIDFKNPENNALNIFIKNFLQCYGIKKELKE